MAGAALAAGGIATAAFALPALGFALGPVFEDTARENWQDVGAERRLQRGRPTCQRVINIVAEIGEPGKTTVYVRQATPGATTRATRTSPTWRSPPAARTSAARSATSRPRRRFVCPCHGGVYDFEGEVEGGPPVRPLDRFYTRVRGGQVQVGDRFSLNSELERFSPRDPSNHLDGLWQYLYPSRPTT